MKIITTSIIALMLMVFLTGCSEEAPSIRVYNERPTKANVQIKTAGNTININEVILGQTTNFQNIAEGNSEITAVIQNEAVSPTITFKAVNDYNYTIVVVNSVPPTLKVNSDKK